jgi:hypothetical protein
MSTFIWFLEARVLTEVAALLVHLTPSRCRGQCERLADLAEAGGKPR